MPSTMTFTVSSIAEYLTGTSDEQERLIGFYGEKNAKTPYIRVYFKN